NVCKWIWIEFAFFNHFNFMFVRWLLILFICSDKRCFQNLRYIFKFRMIDDISQRIKTDMTEADILMAVFVGAYRIFRIVYMDDFDAVKSNDFIELFQYTIEVINDIISRIMHVASIKTDAQTFIIFYTVYDLCEFFEVPADFSTFTRHRFKSDLHIIIIAECFIQAFNDGFNPFIRPCADVAAGMQNNLTGT